MSKNGIVNGYQSFPTKKKLLIKIDHFRYQPSFHQNTSNFFVKNRIKLMANNNNNNNNHNNNCSWIMPRIKIIPPARIQYKSIYIGTITQKITNKKEDVSPSSWPSSFCNILEKRNNTNSQKKKTSGLYSRHQNKWSHNKIIQKQTQCRVSDPFIDDYRQISITNKIKLVICR